ncbi:putative fucosyltransferase 9 [Arabidopsis thaliana]
MIKLTIAIATCLVLCLVLLLPSSNISYRHKYDLPTNGLNDSEQQSEKLLGGLLATGFEEKSCLSRYDQSMSKPSPYKPSRHIVSKLRSYEMLHKRCGPGTKAYKRATKQLGHNELSSSGDECRYVVWMPMFGLGNRMLSLVSVFLYALLTDRVMLVDQRNDITDLFCEPFPETSWLLPLDFPLNDQLDSFNREHSRCYGTMLKNHAINSTSIILSHLYLDIFHDSRDHDKKFFCEEDQAFLDKVTWLVVKSNLYFVPSLWMIPSFQTKLIKLFPQKETVFHHLARYLFHPTNQVWGMVTRSYNAYLSRADERLGIQVRVFSKPAGYFQHVMDQILYSDHLKNMFLEQASSTEETIEVYQPSGEKIQQTDKKLHDQKALAEIYLLSLTDELVTSTRSTFGYVAQGLGGLKPWILYEPRDKKTPNPPCVRAMSMEPCFLRAPLHGCQAKTIKIPPFVRICEDWKTGLKLVDVSDEL